MRPIRITIFILSVILFYPFTQIKAQTQKRAMTFLDIMEMRSLGDRRNGDISPDGKWLVYTLYVPDWEKGKRFSDIYITPLIGGKITQLTFTKDYNERFLKWHKNSSFFAFLSNCSEDKNQIYFMRPDGGEAQKVTDDKFGISSYEWSKDCKYLVYLGGRPEERQIWIMPGEGGDAEKLTDHKTPVSSFLWNPDREKIYFVASESVDLLDKERNEKGFDVQIFDQVELPFHLWEIDIETKEEKRLTGGNEYSVSEIIISDDGTKIAFIGSSTKRYTTYLESEVYLLDLNTNAISRITNNSVDEWSWSFSPDSKWFAYTCAGDEIFMNLGKIYIMPTEPTEESATKKLLSNFDYDDFLSYFWSEDSRYIYFNSQVGVDFHLFRVSIDNDQIEQITKFGGKIFVKKDKDSENFLISYSDSENPQDYYYTEPANFNDRDKWIKLTDANPQVKGFLLGKQETIRWRSTDGRTIEGLLIKPVNYREDRKYPLIVHIHGGPAAAFINNFKGYVHIFAAKDFVVFQPNYRGSTGYGEKFMKEIAGNYFGLSFDDIMTGVDYLIEREMVHPDSMGIMGWSAGGDLSNWALVSTDRFKAISTGASSVNLISDGASSMGEFYFKGTPYDKWDDYVEMSPIRYIKNANTPTLIQCGEYDKNNIHQCEELYIALKKLGVPTEFIVYPNTGHVIWNMMRYEMVKMQAEFNWFEKWIRGKEGWIDWKEMIETLQ